MTYNICVCGSIEVLFFSGSFTELAVTFYGWLFAISVLCSAFYIIIWHKHFDVNLSIIFTLVPVANAGYLLSALSQDADSALTAVKVVYFGGCFLPFFILHCILNMCQFEIHKRLSIWFFLICIINYACVISAGYSDLFYKGFSFEVIDGIPVLHKEYGVMHNVFYGMTIMYLAFGLIAIGYSWFKKKQVPRTIIALLVLPDILSVCGYFFTKLLNNPLEMVPLSYVLAQVIYLVIAHRACLYDVADTVIDSMVQETEIGYISFDFKYRYLGGNNVAKRLVPRLEKIAVDDVFGYDPSEKKILHYLDSFRSNHSDNTFLYTVKSPDGNPENDKYYNVNVNYLYDGNHKRGYIVTFNDDTENRKYIRLLDSYNEKLQTEVEDKTRHIVEMHDNLIMSLAVMVESRDNSTGGHIKRTSEGVRILVDEIVLRGELKLTKEFCKDVIKAAPMHDLGKIAVDDAVLRKPGRFTDEEYEKMKKHSAEGARVIHEILLNTDDESFKKVAENVAHYHHERWDGSGYPEGLKGEEIPLEARIMAIADVYDALVSKRVYKEAFDFKKADSIIMEGMGTQFDPRLKSAYEKARPRLEEYYGRGQD